MADATVWAFEGQKEQVAVAWFPGPVLFVPMGVAPHEVMWESVVQALVPVHFDLVLVYMKMSYVFISILMQQPCRDVVHGVRSSPSSLRPGNSGTWHESRLYPEELDRGRKRSS